MKNITAIRCLLMLPASCIASGLLMLIGSRLGNIVVVPSTLLFLTTFECVMPKKNIWLRILNVLFSFWYIFFYSKGLKEMFSTPEVMKYYNAEMGKISDTNKHLAEVFKAKGISVEDIKKLGFAEDTLKEILEFYKKA